VGIIVVAFCRDKIPLLALVLAVVCAIVRVQVRHRIRLR
jgi:cell division protein FtsL